MPRDDGSISFQGTTAQEEYLAAPPFRTRSRCRYGPTCTTFEQLVRAACRSHGRVSSVCVRATYSVIYRDPAGVRLVRAVTEVEAEAAGVSPSNACNRMFDCERVRLYESAFGAALIRANGFHNGPKARPLLSKRLQKESLGEGKTISERFLPRTGTALALGGGRISVKCCPLVNAVPGSNVDAVTKFHDGRETLVGKNGLPQFDSNQCGKELVARPQR